MRKTVTTILMLAISLVSITAQTLNVSTGNITTVFNVTTEEMLYDNEGQTLTISGKTYKTSNIDSIYVNDSEIPDNNVSVLFNDAKTNIIVSGNIASKLSIETKGANVCILQDSTVNEEITYTLSGISDNGSFYMDGDYKATIKLNGLLLTSNDSAAINIRNGKRIAVELIEGTVNKLSDSSSGNQKGCFMVNGHTEFKKGGSLYITGNSKHGFWGDEYVELKKTTGVITIDSPKGDGMNINQYFLMKGGTVNINNVGDDGIAVAMTDDEDDEMNGEVLLEGGTLNINVTASAAKGIKGEGLMTVEGGSYNITTSGNGVYDSTEKDTKACACLKSNGNMIINGGELTLKSTGSGGKGISSDGTLTISGGTINVTTTGTRYTYSSSLRSSAKGIKSDGALLITGGNINARTTGGEGSEGIESKSTLTVDGGEIYIYSYDDAMNSKSNMTINGGYIYAQATKNDALDANQNVYINGGNIAAIGASSPECAIDAAEGYSIIVNGGNVIGIGGSTSKTATSSKQAGVAFSATVSGREIGLFDSSGTGLMYFEVPTTNCKAIYMTVNGMVASQSYTLKYNVSVEGGTTWNGLNTDGTITGGTNLATGTSAISVGSSGGGPGGGNRPGH